MVCQIFQHKFQKNLRFTHKTPINGNRVTDDFWSLISKAYTDAQLILPTKDIEDYIKIIRDLM